MKAVYLRAPYQFEIRDVDLRELRDGEVLVKIKACGYCGHDNILAKYAAKEWEPFGHEFSGIVAKAGKGTAGLAEGDTVVVETSTFDPLADCSRDGRVDFSVNGPSFMELKDNSMGFAEYAIVPHELCVKYDGLSFEEASVIEPLGVALDLVKTADIRLNDDVLVLGAGPIGLMALQMAKSSGARKIYAAEFSANKKRCELAKQFGADELIYTDRVKLEDYGFEKGGVDKVMVSAPPSTITSAVNVCRTGGVVAFLGISYGPDAVVSFDSNKVHLDKLQIRGSNAIPALYFPMCIDMLKAGLVDTKSLITHTFPLLESVEGLERYLKDAENAVKAVMIND
ncbi:zinc-dependent alcohol dehydrogenase [Christensenella intestinihominis]|uniref:zinc-dependent alcohol dehydrogenase n=1 Tax=Christensenella intestinihominis TaxID=1851429 RepID=UPI00082B4184|nr:zinc-binding dehydrogenase [Christensenella intestinihominis]